MQLHFFPLKVFVYLDGPGAGALLLGEYSLLAGFVVAKWSISKVSAFSSWRRHRQFIWPRHPVMTWQQLLCLESRREQYYWMRYWYWVILGCFRNIDIGIGLYWGVLERAFKILVLVFGIVRNVSKYWVLLRPFINSGIGYC